MASLLPDGIEDSLETRLNKATNPLQLEENWESIVGFCDLINKDIDGPQIAVRLLVHKMQSPQEKESLFALTTLEACVRNCGQRFQQEIGKFRFINETIKIISPKYLGNQRSMRVKNRCISLLFFWSQILTQEPKIKEAYHMLKKQGIVKEDPDIYHVNPAGPDKPIEVAQPPPPPPSAPVLETNSIFDDEEKSKLLSRLLRSKNPEDLQAANRLIKNMVKQEAERTEKVTRRTHQLETVSNNVKLLNEMLQNYQPGNSTESDREIMKELSENIEKQRPALFRLASDSDERDSTGIAEILRGNDEVIQVLSLYDALINKSDIGNLLAIEDDGSATSTSSSSISKNLTVNKTSTKNVTKELNSFDILTSNLLLTFPNDDDLSNSFLDEQLLSLGLTDTKLTTTTTASSSDNDLQKNNTNPELDELNNIFTVASTKNSVLSSNSASLLGNVSATPGIPPHSSAFQPPSTTPGYKVGASVLPNYFVSTSNNSAVLSILSPSMSILTKTTTAAATAPATTTTTTSATTLGLGSLDELSKTLLQQTLSISGLKPYQPTPNPTKVTLNQMGKSTSMVVNGNATATNTTKLPLETPNIGAEGHSHNDKVIVVGPLPLDDIFVPLEAIKPGLKPSKVVYEKDDIKVIFHFAAEWPRPDVQVTAIMVTSASQLPVKDLSLLVTAAEQEKLILVKMQPPSSSYLPPYNPILPPSAITQVLLVASTNEVNVRLKVKVTYKINNDKIIETRDVDL